MKTIRILSIILLSISMMSCSSSTSKEEKEFYSLLQEVFEVHDEMMPQMGKLSELRQELEEKTSDDPMNVMVYEEAIADLEAAHKGMMDWMKDFGEVFPFKDDRLEGMNEDQIKESIEKMKLQKVSVEAMKEKMVNSMENAKTILKE